MKRSAAQEEFDRAKHGWAFCNKATLSGKINRLAEIAGRLSGADPRHEELEVMVQSLGRES